MLHSKSLIGSCNTSVNDINYWDPRKRGGNWEERDKGEARESIHKVPRRPAVLSISLSRNAQWTRCTLATQIPSFWSPKTKELYWSSKCETVNKKFLGRTPALNRNRTSFLEAQPLKHPGAFGFIGYISLFWFCFVVFWGRSGCK